MLLGWDDSGGLSTRWSSTRTFDLHTFETLAQKRQTQKLRFRRCKTNSGDRQTQVGHYHLSQLACPAAKFVEHDDSNMLDDNLRVLDCLS